MCAIRRRSVVRGRAERARGRRNVAVRIAQRARDVGGRLAHEVVA
jgi:hypothetical protein